MSTIAPSAPGSRLAAVPRRLLRLRSDAALAERFAAGDEAAFAVLYERHRPSVLAVCIGVLGCRDDAEDAAQEVFASLAVALRAEGPRELRPWLVRVARNAAIDARRRRRGRAAKGAETEVVAAGPGSDGVRVELELVLAAVRELPESQRTALLMRELAGHSYGEIAALLGCDEEAVRGLIARARIGVRNHREATELPCVTARQAMAAEPDGRRQDKVVRRHVRRCASCQAYRRALRADAHALHGLAPGPVGGLAGGGAVVSAAAKGILAGGALTQVGAACAVSLCSAGGVVLLAPHLVAHRSAPPAHHRRVVDGRGSGGAPPDPHRVVVNAGSSAGGSLMVARLGSVMVPSRPAPVRPAMVAPRPTSGHRARDGRAGGGEDGRQRGRSLAVTRSGEGGATGGGRRTGTWTGAGTRRGGDGAGAPRGDGRAQDGGWRTGGSGGSGSGSDVRAGSGGSDGSGGSRRLGRFRRVGDGRIR